MGRPYDDLGCMIASLYVMWKCENIAAAYIIKGFWIGYSGLDLPLMHDTMVVAGARILRWVRLARRTPAETQSIIEDATQMIEGTHQRLEIMQVIRGI